MQDKNVESFINELMKRYPQLVVVRKEIEESYEVLKKSYQNGGKLLIAGMVEAAQTRNILLAN